MIKEPLLCMMPLLQMHGKQMAHLAANWSVLSGPEGLGIPAACISPQGMC